MRCNEVEILMYAYIDKMLDGKRLAALEEHLLSCPACREKLALLRKQEKEISAVLTPCLPPDGFSGSVMDMLAREDAKTNVFPLVAARAKRQKMVRIMGGLAAAGMLFWGSVLYTPDGQNPGTVNVATPGQTEPDSPDTTGDPDALPDEPGTPGVADPDGSAAIDSDTAAAAGNKPAGNTVETVTPAAVNTVVADNSSTGGAVALPEPSYSTQSYGSFSLTLLASFADSDVYAPAFNTKGDFASFYIFNGDELLLWKTALDQSTEPSFVASSDEVADKESMASSMQELTAENPTRVSPDGTMVASNIAGENLGVWLAGVSSKNVPELLSEKGGGKLLSWAPNSSKFVFTDSSGALYVCYPVEKLVYTVAAGEVNEIVWGEDSSAILLLLRSDGSAHMALYKATLP